MKRKSSTRRTRRRIAGVKGLPKTKKFAGVTFTKKACSKLKGDATKSAKAAREAGKKARVAKNPAGGYCVYTRSK